MNAARPRPHNSLAPFSQSVLPALQSVGSDAAEIAELKGEQLNLDILQQLVDAVRGVVARALDGDNVPVVAAMGAAHDEW